MDLNDTSAEVVQKWKQRKHRSFILEANEPLISTLLLNIDGW